MWPNRPKNLREHAAITHHRSEPEVEFVGGEGGMGSSVRPPCGPRGLNNLLWHQTHERTDEGRGGREGCRCSAFACDGGSTVRQTGEGRGEVGGGMERGDRNRAAGIGARNATETKYNSPGGPVGIVIR